MMLEPKWIADVLLLAFAAMELLRPRHIRQLALVDNSPDRGTTLVLAGCYCTTVLVLNTTTFPVLPLPVPDWVAWTGLALSAAGLVLRCWTAIELRRFYSRAATAIKPRQMIRSGPYRVIRHPGRLGSLAVWSGATAASGNPVALFTVAVAMLAAYAVRISNEEAMFGTALGPAYDAYRRRSWRLIPFVY